MDELAAETENCLCSIEKKKKKKNITQQSGWQLHVRGWKET